MSDWETSVKHYHPVRDIDTYKRMIALAIAERDRHTDMSEGFKLCIPTDYINEIASHFPHYQYALLGECIQDRTQMYVRWYPYAT